MADSSDLGALVGTVSAGAVIVDPAQMEAYRWDRALDPDAGVPLAVVRAEDADDVAATLRFAAERGIVVVPRGAGSGLSGGSSAQDGCIVLSLDRMRSVTIDPVLRVAICQPGAFNAEVKSAAREHGLWYPPDPSSYEFCSIGGNVATNAGGLCCVKYGVTGDYVLGLTVVLADGRIVKLGGPRLKDVAGLSLTKLFVGSEGTLGVITEVILRLIPSPQPTTTMVATFPDLGKAMQAVIDITQRMRPSMLEFMDSTCINAVEDLTRMGLDRAAAGMLIVQSDEPGDFAEQQMALAAAICEGIGSSECYHTADAEEGEMLVSARRMAIPAVERTGTILLEDVGVPIPRLADLVLGIAAIGREYDVTIAVMAHAGDGNTHPLIVSDPTDSAQQARAALAYGKVMDLAISLGGTITGEHGVGRLKRPWLEGYLGEDVMQLNRAVKSALDPRGILNAGSVFERLSAD